MGRPINSRYLKDAAGAIKVSHYRRSTGTEATGGEDTYITRQRSTNKFIVADTSSAWSEVLTLVDKAAGTLLNGEFRISGQDSDGSEYNVTRLYNRTLRLGDTTGVQVKAAWLIGAPADLVITGITEADPGVVTVASTATLATGDIVTLSGVVGMTEVNGNSYTVTVINATTFSIGVDTTGFTTYVSDGVVGGVGSSASIAVQAT
jgi:hypothetical protein